MSGKRAKAERKTNAEKNVQAIIDASDTVIGFEEIEGRPDQYIAKKTKCRDGDFDNVMICTDKQREEKDENGDVIYVRYLDETVSVSRSAADTYKSMVKNTLMMFEDGDTSGVDNSRYTEKDIAELVKNKLVTEYKNPDDSINYIVGCMPGYKG